MDDNNITINSISDDPAKSSPPANSTQNSAPVSSDDSTDEELEDSVKLFQEKLMEELCFDKMEPVEKTEVEQKLAKLVNDRIINLILIYLPEKKAPELNELLEKGNQDEVLAFVSENIPDISEKMTNELMLLRSELLEKMK